MTLLKIILPILCLLGLCIAQPLGRMNLDSCQRLPNTLDISKPVRVTPNEEMRDGILRMIDLELRRVKDTFYIFHHILSIFFNNRPSRT